MGEPWGHYSKWNREDTKGQTPSNSTYAQCLDQSDSETDRRAAAERGLGSGLSGTEFQLGKMRQSQRWMVVLLVQQCEYTWCPWTVVVCVCVWVCVCTCSVASVVSNSATLWTVARQAPLSMGFSRQQCWSGLPCSSPGDLPDPGIEPESLMSPALAGRFFITSATWETLVQQDCVNCLRLESQ